MKTSQLTSIYLMSGNATDLDAIKQSIETAGSFLCSDVVTGGQPPTSATEEVRLWGSKQLSEDMAEPPDLTIVSSVTEVPHTGLYGMAIMSAYNIDNLHFGLLDVDEDTEEHKVGPCLCLLAEAEMWQNLLDRDGMEAVSVHLNCSTQGINDEHDDYKEYEWFVAQYFGHPDDNEEKLAPVGLPSPVNAMGVETELPFAATALKDAPWVFYPLKPAEGVAIMTDGIWGEYVEWAMYGTMVDPNALGKFNEVLKVLGIEDVPATEEEVVQPTLDDAVDQMLATVAQALVDGTAAINTEENHVTITVDGFNLETYKVPDTTTVEDEEPVEEEPVIEYVPEAWADDVLWTEADRASGRCGVLLATGCSCPNVATKQRSNYKQNNLVQRVCNRHGALMGKWHPVTQKDDEVKKDEGDIDIVAHAQPAHPAYDFFTTTLPTIGQVGFATDTLTPMALNEVFGTNPAAGLGTMLVGEELPVTPDAWGMVYGKLDDDKAEMLGNAFIKAGGIFDVDEFPLDQETIAMLKPLLVEQDDIKGIEIVWVMSLVMKELNEAVDA
jgi:hypothetical protein